jgi:hypothetical protein
MPIQKVMGKIRVVYVLIFMFLNGNQKVVLLQTLLKCGGNQQLGLLVAHYVFMPRKPTSGSYLTL